MYCNFQACSLNKEDVSVYLKNVGFFSVVNKREWGPAVLELHNRQTSLHGHALCTCFNLGSISKWIIHYSKEISL